MLPLRPLRQMPLRQALQLGRPPGWVLVPVLWAALLVELLGALKGEQVAAQAELLVALAILLAVLPVALASCLGLAPRRPPHRERQ